MRSLKIFTVACLTLFLMVSVVSADEIKISSGGTTATYVLNPIKEHFEKETGLKLIITTVGGKFAILELDKGNTEMAGAAHTLEELLEIMRKDGIELKNMASIQVHPVSEPVNYAIVTHKENPVIKLSKEQVKGIFTGKITNWKEVGGSDMPILVVIPKLQPAGNRTLSNKMLDKEPILKDVLEVNTYSDVKESVSVNKEAIGMIMEAQVDAKVKKLETDKITTGPINFFTIGKPSPRVQKLIDYTIGEGKKYILK